LNFIVVLGKVHVLFGLASRYRPVNEVELFGADVFVVQLDCAGPIHRIKRVALVNGVAEHISPRTQQILILLLSR